MTLYFLFLLITGGISAAIIHICKLPASPDAFAMAVVPLHALFCMMKGKGQEETDATVFILRSYKVSFFLTWLIGAIVPLIQYLTQPEKGINYGLTLPFVIWGFFQSFFVYFYRRKHLAKN